jgi:hypothetical protein
MASLWSLCPRAVREWNDVAQSLKKRVMSGNQASHNRGSELLYVALLRMDMPRDGE